MSRLPAEATPTIRTEPFQIPARDQMILAGTLFRPARPNNHTVLIAGALGIRQTYYQAFARYLAEQGFVALTFDYRGMGASRKGSLNHYEAHLWQWGAYDLQAMLYWLDRQFPAHESQVVGHGLGGAMLGMAQYAPRVSSLLGVAVQSAYWALWPWHSRLQMAFIHMLAVPLTTQLSGHFPAGVFGLGDPAPKHIGMEWAAAARKREYLLATARATEHNYYEAFTGALRLLSFRDDGFAPQKAVDAVARLYPHATSVERQHIDPATLSLGAIGHMRFFKPEMQETLWAEAAAWLAKPQERRTGAE